MGPCSSRQRIAVNGRSYKELSEIGEGGFSHVYLVQDKAKQRFALKIVTAEPEGLERALREAEFLKRFAGQHILGLEDYEVKDAANNNKQIYFVLPLCPGGSLFEYAERRRAEEKPFSEEEIVEIFRQLCVAIKCLHDAGIVHRDIKVENLLLQRDPSPGNFGAWVLCDFGSAVEENATPVADKAGAAALQEDIDRSTTPLYRAPEMFHVARDVVVDRAVDIWAAGVFLFQLAFGKLPFESKLATLSGRVMIPDSHPFSEKLVALVTGMLSMERTDRPSVDDLLVAIERDWGTPNKQ